MSSLKKNILIIDDDNHTCEAISRYLKKKNYEVFISNSPEDAIRILRLEFIDLLIVDCMLPSKNGVDFVESIRSTIGEIPVYFITGIFLDRSFSEDALGRTRALGFFYKPLDMEKFFLEIKKSLDSNQINNPAPLQDLWGAKLEGDFILKALESRKKIQALELPLVILELLRAKWLGSLFLNKDSHCIEFRSGRICSITGVGSNDVYKFIFVNHKYIDPELISDIKISPEEDLLEYYLKENKISPHCRTEINNLYPQSYLDYLFSQKEHLTIKLTNSINENHFVDLGRKEFKKIFNKYAKTVNLDALKGMYAPSNKKLLSMVSLDNSEVKQIFKNLNDSEKFYLKLDQKLEGENIESLCSQFSENLVYRAIYFLASYRCIRILSEDERRRIVDFKEKIYYLTHEIQNKNHTEIMELLGTSSYARPKEVDSTFKDFAKRHHSDFLPIGLSDELRGLNDKVFLRVSIARDTLCNTKKREEYSLQCKRENAINQMDSDKFISKAHRYLQTRRYEEARNLLKEAYNLVPSDNTSLYIMWAELKMQGTKSETNSDWRFRMKGQFQNLSFKSKGTYLYHLVYGIYLKSAGEIRTSFVELNKALKVNPRGLQAKRELLSLKNITTTSISKKGSEESILNSNISEVMSRIFKKKTK